MWATPTAPVPPPPEKLTAGGAVYPEPPVVMEMETTWPERR